MQFISIQYVESVLDIHIYVDVIKSLVSWGLWKKGDLLKSLKFIQMNVRTRKEVLFKNKNILKYDHYLVYKKRFFCEFPLSKSNAIQSQRVMSQCIWRYK